ncbi:MAG: PBP1A family penicillin-binding protein [Bryobacteraceae bacterium]|nr:PBP1A family penicillin-binding protein [Bryobacteraceae bacterium]
MRDIFRHPLAGHPIAKGLLIAGVVGVTLAFIALSVAYLRFAQIIDEKLEAGPISNSAMLFAAPRKVAVGDDVDIEEIVGQLRASGYTDSRSNRLGWYNVRPDAVEIFPGKDSFAPGEGAVIKFTGRRVSQIISLRDNTDRTEHLLEPELLTNLFDRDRKKRRIVAFHDLPKTLVNAVIAAEDKRFFQHAGFDPIRVLKAAYVNVREERISQGASTLSMQLAGDLWLDRKERTWRRKAGEVLITLHLERKLTKEQIFEYYANQIYLGNVGSFSIHGFGQAAQAYFNKDIRHLTLPEAALLAGLPRGPNLYNPFRNSARAKARRDWVLDQMLENGAIGEPEYREAIDAPLGVAAGGADAGDAPYFVDLAYNWLRQRYPSLDFQSQGYRIYTTLDMNLQREAVEALRVGLKEVDDRCRRLGRTREKGWPEVQAALVALDPRTGAVRALVGGRHYGGSQLNRALAKRPPGSVFKPFVFATALNTALEDTPYVLTTTTHVADEPTTFWFDDKPYEPKAYQETYFGDVTLRRALAKSLNVPTVRVAEMVGYDHVVDLARRCGLNMNILPTPAVALGSYEVTPLEIAGAYTVFANRGEVLKPYQVQMIRETDGEPLFESAPAATPVLDPRVAYLMVDLLQEVLRSGTGVRARALGFSAPAAGKTGSSHDGWFAGFTSELLSIVWVGYDDYRDIKMEGAQTALPIWTEFMKRALNYREYRKAKPFEAPDGIVNVEVDPVSGKLAAGGCGSSPQKEVFIAGTQPVEMCDGRGTQVAGWQVGADEPALVAASGGKPRVAVRRPVDFPTGRGEPPKEQEPKPKKKGFFGRILDIFR